MKVNQKIKATIVKGLKELGCEVAKAVGQKVVNVATEIQSSEGRVVWAGSITGQKIVGVMPDLTVPVGYTGGNMKTGDFQGGRHPHGSGGAPLTPDTIITSNDRPGTI
jgi:hypothetical protein